MGVAGGFGFDGRPRSFARTRPKPFASCLDPRPPPRLRVQSRQGRHLSAPRTTTILPGSLTATIFLRPFVVGYHRAPMLWNRLGEVMAAAGIVPVGLLR